MVPLRPVEAGARAVLGSCDRGAGRQAGPSLIPSDASGRPRSPGGPAGPRPARSRPRPSCSGSPGWRARSAAPSRTPTSASVLLRAVPAAIPERLQERVNDPSRRAPHRVAVDLVGEPGPPFSVPLHALLSLDLGQPTDLKLQDLIDLHGARSQPRTLGENANERCDQEPGDDGLGRRERPHDPQTGGGGPPPPPRLP